MPRVFRIHASAWRRVQSDMPFRVTRSAFAVTVFLVVAALAASELAAGRVALADSKQDAADQIASTAGLRSLRQ